MTKGDNPVFDCCFQSCSFHVAQEVVHVRRETEVKVHVSIAGSIFSQSSASKCYELRHVLPGLLQV